MPYPVWTIGFSLLIVCLGAFVFGFIKAMFKDVFLCCDHEGCKREPHFKRVWRGIRISCTYRYCWRHMPAATTDKVYQWSKINEKTAWVKDRPTVATPVHIQIDEYNDNRSKRKRCGCFECVVDNKIP